MRKMEIDIDNTDSVLEELAMNIESELDGLIVEETMEEDEDLLNILN